MKKINIILGVFFMMFAFTSCEKEENEISSEESFEVTLDEAIDKLNKSREEEPGGTKDNFIFVEDLSIVEGLWEVKEIKNRALPDFTPVDAIETDRLFFPVSTNGLPEVKFIQIKEGEISLIDENQVTVLNSFDITNYTIGRITIAGLFNIDLSTVTTGSSNARISVTSFNGDLRIGQPFNGRDGVEYRLEKIN